MKLVFRISEDDSEIYQLNYGIEYLGLEKVIWFQKVKYADSKSSTYLRDTSLKIKKYTLLTRRKGK